MYVVCHDNASSRTSAQTPAILSSQNIDLVSHPPYNPGLFELNSIQFVNSSKKARNDWPKEMLQKYNRAASKHVYDIVTGDESWIYAYEHESKQQLTVWVFHVELNPTKVARIQSTSKQMIACFFEKKNWTCRNRTTRTMQNNQF